MNNYENVRLFLPMLGAKTTFNNALYDFLGTSDPKHQNWRKEYGIEDCYSGDESFVIRFDDETLIEGTYVKNESWTIRMFLF